VYLARHLDVKPRSLATSVTPLHLVTMTAVMQRVYTRTMALLAVLLMFTAAPLQSADTTYDLVVLGGRVLDPETGLDARRSIGVRAGVVRAISSSPLRGRDTIDASGLVVAPGFIDLHQHAQTPDAYRVEATGGATTVLEMEYGTADVDRWYAEREGRAAINYGVAVGHLQVRKVVMKDPSVADSNPLADPRGDAQRRAATAGERATIQSAIARGLDEGALGVGLAIELTPAASRREVLETFATATRYGATLHVHLRGVSDDPDDVSDIQEAIADATITGASVHVVHLNATARELTPDYLRIIASARAHGVDLTTEMYPYEAAMASLVGYDTSTLASRPDGWFQRFEEPLTGTLLTRATFRQAQAAGADLIIHARDTVQANAWLGAGVENPLPLFASDGMLSARGGHPRVVGTFARILGHYVREEHALSLMDAVRRMTLAPARRLERRVPAMKHKGRIQLGADADLTIFDPGRIADRATYREPTRAPDGIVAVIVNGVPVVRDRQLLESLPGRPVRAVVRREHD
jgi:N-acyl-D-aspartate/D-glutamate deacylase